MSIIYFMVFANQLLAIDKTSTGFFYQTGTANFSSACGKWLSRDSANNGCYFDGSYHVGVDIMANIDGPVYPVSDGIITHKSLNGWGNGNVGVVVKHLNFRTCLK